MGGVNVGGQGSLDSWLRSLGDETIPRHVWQAFGDAFAAGFESYGFAAEWVRALERELTRLPGADRLEALQSTVRAIVRTARLVEEGEWSNLQAIAGRDPFEALLRQITDTIDGIGLISAGWQDMTLIDRAAELETIDDLFESTLGNVLSMLTTIQQRQEEIERGWASWATGMQFSALESDDARIHFAQSQLEAAFTGLEGATTAREIDRWNAEVQRWLDTIAGMVDLNDFTLGDPMGTTGGSWLEWLLDQGSRASGLASGGYQSLEDELQERYQEMHDTLRDVNDQLRDFNDTLRDLNNPATDPPPGPWDQGDDPAGGWGPGDDGPFGGGGKSYSQPTYITVPAPQVSVAVYDNRVTYTVSQTQTHAVPAIR
jgi:hypothetical protein